jgi:hypothetical protein
LALFQAWHAGLFPKMKRYPRLEQVVSGFDRKPPRKRSSGEVIALFEDMNAKLGGRDLRKKEATNE